MASLIRDADGSFRIEVVVPSGSRKRVRLGKMPVKMAQSWRHRIEALASDLTGGEAHSRDLASWLVELPEKLHERLVKAGLARARAERAAVTLEGLCDTFKARQSVKPGTMATYAQSIDSLITFLGAGRDVTSITVEDADAWRVAIAKAKQGEGRRKKARLAPDNRLAPATVAKRVMIVKRIFSKAVQWRWIESNPFSHLRAGSQANADRNHYVSVEVTESILEACPGPQWRALVGLARFAGLRCPSEIGLLAWDDVDLHGGRLRVRSPKTEAHEGGAVRFVPVAPNLASILNDAFGAAADGSKLVCPMASDPSKNLRTGFQRIIARANCETWPRLFQNLRASGETDWAQTYPAHVCAKWLGHSPRIAQGHYLMALDHHFRDVIEGPTKRGAESGAVGDRQGVSGMDNRSGSDGVFLGEYVNPAVVNTYPVGSTGFEPVTSTV